MFPAFIQERLEIGTEQDFGNRNSFVGMSETTESSDWRNLSPRSLPAHILPEREGAFMALPHSLISQNQPTALLANPSLPDTLHNNAIGTSSDFRLREGEATEPQTAMLEKSTEATDQDTPRRPPALEYQMDSAPATLEKQSTAGPFATALSNTEARDTLTPKPARGGARGGNRRGRAGGARKPRIKVEPADTDDAPTFADVPQHARTVNRGGRPRGSRTVNRGGRPRGSRAGVSSVLSSRKPIKRKRKSQSDDEDADDTSASEAMNLPQLSNSGRRITQAKTFTPITIDLDPPTSSTAKKPRTVARVSDVAPVFLTGAMKRKRARNPAEAAVCRNCGRGHSPNTNQIVFCDGCNTPWHQFCHDRPITPTVIEFEDKEWQCADCEIENSLANVGKGMVNAEALAQTSGIDRTLKWKQDYLTSLDKNVLVSLLLKAHEQHEEMPLFEPNARFGFTVSAAVPLLEARAEKEAKRAEAEEEGQGKEVGSREGKAHEEEAAPADFFDEDEGFYEEPLPYPKMGNGLFLPPEQDDLDILVDENEVVYSHSWREGPDELWKGPLAEQIFPSECECEFCHQKGDVVPGSNICRRCASLPSDGMHPHDEMNMPALLNGWHGGE